MLDKETVQSQFTNATGLKYIEGGDWVAVHATGTNFAIPENVDRLVVVTETVGKTSCYLQFGNCTFCINSVPYFSGENYGIKLLKVQFYYFHPPSYRQRGI